MTPAATGKEMAEPSSPMPLSPSAKSQQWFSPKAGEIGLEILVRRKSSAGSLHKSASLDSLEGEARRQRRALEESIQRFSLHLGQSLLPSIVDSLSEASHRTADLEWESDSRGGLQSVITATEEDEGDGCSGESELSQSSHGETSELTQHRISIHSSADGGIESSGSTETTGCAEGAEAAENGKSFEFHDMMIEVSDRIHSWSSSEAAEATVAAMNMELTAEMASKQRVACEGSECFKNAAGPVNPVTKAGYYFSVLLFVDISGFTRLSTILDAERFSAAINSYFEMIINEVTAHGGDILKFAGDAMFVEWQVESLSPANCSLRTGLLTAASCGAKIVEVCSDFRLPHSGSRASATDAALNVHCGLGVGQALSLEVGDGLYKRTHLILGEIIEQVARAENNAKAGELVASPEALTLLHTFCDFFGELDNADQSEPAVVARKSDCFFESQLDTEPQQWVDSVEPYILTQCQQLDFSMLEILWHLASLYVHPVVRHDERESLDHVMLAPRLPSPDSRTNLLDSLSESELRSVYTVFIKPLISSEVSGDPAKDAQLCRLLDDIMNVTNQQLQRFNGQLINYLVDDKGVVLVAAFGLRGATSPNLVAEKALPATIGIHKALEVQLGVDSRIGATLGMAYCGVVGGAHRHEYSVLGASVNLAARLMAAAHNHGILVDGSVRDQASNRFSFKSLAPVEAKGYENKVPIFEPLVGHTKGWTAAKELVGRDEELAEILAMVRNILTMPSPGPKTKAVLISADTGMGKTSLLHHALKSAGRLCSRQRRTLFTHRHICQQHQQLLPFSALASMFLESMILAIEGGNEASPSSSQGHAPHQGGSHCGRSGQHSQGNGHDHRSRFYARSHVGSAQSTDSGVSPFTCARKLTSICREMGKPEGFSELIGTRFLGLESRYFQSDEQSIRDTPPGEKPKVKMPSQDEVVAFLKDVFLRCKPDPGIAIIAVDDVQWMDGLSCDFVSALYAEARDLMFVFGARHFDKAAAAGTSSFWKRFDQPTESTFGSLEPECRQIQLGPLKVCNLRKLAAKTLWVTEDEIDDELCTNLFRQTGGSPFFAAEILKVMKREDWKPKPKDEVDGNQKLNTRRSSSRRGISHSKSSPLGPGYSSIDELLLHILDGLNNRARKVLHLCAVLGLEFTMTELQQVHSLLEDFSEDDGWEEIVECMRTAVAERILEEETFGGVETDDEDSDFEDDGLFFDLPLFEGTDQMPPLVEDDAEPISRTPSGSRMQQKKEKIFRFSHGIWRETLLGTMLNSKKREMHKSIAILFEAEAAALEAQGMTPTSLQGRCSQQIILFGHWRDSGESGKASQMALVIGRRFEENGLSQNSLDLYEQALAMYQVGDELEDCIESIGGIPQRVLAGMNHVDLQNLVKLQIESAMSLANLNQGAKSAVFYQDAFDIMQEAPAAHEVEDKTLMFPIFSGWFLALRSRHIEDDEYGSYEQSVIARFVNASFKLGDLTHSLRSLAMQVNFLGRHGKLEKALYKQRVLHALYTPQTHTQILTETYGSDHAAQTYGLTAQWYMAMGEERKCTQTLEYVLQHVMPYMDEKNVHNSFMIVYPLLWILKQRGQVQEARKVFEQHIRVPFDKHYGQGGTSFFMPLYRSVEILLDLATFDGEWPKGLNPIEELEDWALKQESGRVDDTLDTMSAQLGRGALGIWAEVMLLLAKRRMWSGQEVTKTRALVDKGLGLADLSLEKDRKEKGTEFGVVHVEEVLEELTEAHLNLGWCC